MWQGSAHRLYCIDLSNTPSSNESSMATLRMPLPGTPPFTHSPECTPAWGVTFLGSNRGEGSSVLAVWPRRKKQARFGPLEQRGGVSLAGTTSAPLTTHCGSHHALRHDGRCVGSRSRVGGTAPPPTTHSDCVNFQKNEIAIRQPDTRSTPTHSPPPTRQRPTTPRA